MKGWKAGTASLPSALFTSSLELLTEPDVNSSGSIILISSRHSVNTFSCMALMSTIAAEHCRKRESSAAVTSAPEGASAAEEFGVVARDRFAGDVAAC